MSEINNDIDILISKKLAGEASADELVKLELWIISSDANRKYADQFTTIFEKVGALREFQKFDTDAAWIKLKSKLHKKETKVVRFKPSHLFQQYWHVAASVLLVIGLGYFSYNWFVKPQDVVAVASEGVRIEKRLPDGTRAFLNKGTSLQYQYNPIQKKRVVKLEGEAHFAIADKKEKPFVINADEVIIEDIGTTFNVDAYPNSDLIEVYVETGEVALYTLQDPGIHVTAGETGIYNKQTKTFAKLSELNENVVAYKTGVFVFRDARLKDVAAALNEVYDRKLKLENKKLEACRITVTFRDETLDVIADVLAETLKLTITKSDTEITLHGEGCAK